MLRIISYFTSQRPGAANQNEYLAPILNIGQSHFAQ